MVRFAPTRMFYIPKGAAKITIKSVDGGEVYWVKTVRDRIHAVAFKGRAQKPFVNAYYRSYDGMVKDMTRVFTNIAERNETKKREREVIQKMDHGVKVGDIFSSSWGYEQTNVSFYQVVELKGKQSAVIRRIAGIRHYDGPMSGKMVADKDQFLANYKPETKRIQISGKKQDGSASVYIKMESFEYAYPWKGEAMRFSEWH